MNENERKNETSTENFFTKEEIISLITAMLTVKAATGKKEINNVSIIKTDCLAAVISKALALWDMRPATGYSSEVLSGQLYVLDLAPSPQNKSSTRIVRVNKSFFNDLFKIFNDLLFVAYLASINCLDRSKDGAVAAAYGEWLKKYIPDAVKQRAMQTKFLEAYEGARQALENALLQMLEKPSK